MPEIVDVYADRADRPCMGCGKRDKAPRDQVNLQDGNVALYHWDCHILIANCEVCKKSLEALDTHEGPDGLKDEALHARIHEEMNKPFKARAKIFTTDEAVPQDLPNAK